MPDNGASISYPTAAIGALTTNTIPSLPGIETTSSAQRIVSSTSGSRSGLAGLFMSTLVATFADVGKGLTIEPLVKQRYSFDDLCLLKT